MTQQVDARYSSSWHTPVLVDEVLRVLAPRAGGRYVDATLGGGGHSHAILDYSAPDGQLLCIDRDPAAIAFATERLAQFGDRARFVQGNYADLTQHVGSFGPVDGVLLDAGVSSRQLDDPARGFSFRAGGPLDMRMGPDTPSLADYLASTDEVELARIFRTYGELRDAGRIAARVLEGFHDGAFDTTDGLAQLVEREGGGIARKAKIHPATLVFQALRIAVNDELTGLERALQALPDVLAPGGRALFISFHSLEDRIIKQHFRALTTVDAPPGLPLTNDQLQPFATPLTRKPITASDDELHRNPRARSAKLRAIVRTSP